MFGPTTKFKGIGLHAIEVAIHLVAIFRQWAWSATVVVTVEVIVHNTQEVRIHKTNLRASFPYRPIAKEDSPAAEPERVDNTNFKEHHRDDIACYGRRNDQVLQSMSRRVSINAAWSWTL